jgi:gephyrin
LNGQLKHAMPLDPRTEYHRAIIRSVREGLVAESTGGQRSSRVASLSGANGLVVVPPKAEGGPKEMIEGAMIEAILIGEILM